MKLPIYECPVFSQYVWSSQRFPVSVIAVQWTECEDDYDKECYPHGYIMITAHDGRGFDYIVKLKCYISRKGRYAIWGNHRIYEGYSGAIILRGVPHFDNYDIIRNVAKQYGTIVDDKGKGK